MSTSAGADPPSRSSPEQSRPWRLGHAVTVRLHGWRHRNVLAAAAVAFAAGFGQFGVTAVLGDVAEAFGEVTGGGSIAAQVGLSATVLGVGLAVIRASSLLSLPLSGLADRLGRRRTIIWYAAIGLALTAASALSPSYWAFVAIIAAGRPLLSATNAIGGVIAAEETRAADRSKAVALVIASYALGAGIVALVRAPLGEDASFRVVMALAVVPLLALPVIRRMVAEPDRFTASRAAARDDAGTGRAEPRLGAVPARWRGRLLLVAGLTLAANLVTGPVNTFLFVYGENVLGASRAQTASAVLAAGPVGLLGLLAGRWGADRWGRRVTAGVAQFGVAVAGVITYVGTLPTLLAGYLLTIGFGGAYGPAMGALSAELFPTRIRATAAGWQSFASVVGAVVGLVVFGVASDVAGSFTTAAVVVGTPVALAALAFSRLPETRGQELEESAPDEQAAAGDATRDATDDDGP